ncbi:MAG: ACT domain-containing protein [Cyanobacteria bacterium P01_H01_bin.74]
MLKKYVISGTGQDKPGIVAAVTTCLNRFNANIEDSTMTRMVNMFAVILVVSVPEETNHKLFVETLSNPEETSGTALQVQRLPEQSDLPKQQAPLPYILSVAGNDRTGITHAVASVLAEFQVNITDLSAQTIAGEAGQPVYIMMIEVEIPAETGLKTSDLKISDLKESSSETSGLNAFNLEAFKQALQQVAEKTQMEVRIRPLETLAL